MNWLCSFGIICTMSKNKFVVLLYYNYVQIDEPERLKRDQEELCRRLNLNCRIIVASEGINGTLEGLEADTEEYIRFMMKDSRFKNMHFKKSLGTGNAFPKISIKLRPELVAGHLGKDDINPNQITGKYLHPEELNRWFKENKKFYIVDMRNDYETTVGYFKDSILPSLRNFRDLPEILPKLKSLKNETVLTVCTGGVRCEKASGYLVKKGFKDVYQLNGGIVSYMEKYPNEDFLGKLYVFDGRVTMGFNLDSPEHKVVGKCEDCFKTADKYIDCANLHCTNKRHFISCDECFKKNKGYCKNCFNN